MIRHRQITAKLAELGVTEDATPDRLALPVSDFKLCIHLRAERLDARYTQGRQVTVQGREYGRAVELMHVWERQPGNWLAEGRTLIGHG